MSDDNTMFFHEERACKILVEEIFRYRRKTNGDPVTVGAGLSADDKLQMLVKIAGGWATGTTWPLQHGDGGYSASFLLIHPAEGFVFIETDPVEEDGKIIPENDILRLPGGFHTQPGYFHTFPHAANKFYENFGLDVEAVAKINEHWRVTTEYPDGEPLGALEHPRRVATTYFGYVNDFGLDVVKNNPLGRKVVVLGHAEFIKEAHEASLGNPSKLSRLPQQCADFCHLFRNGMKPDFF